MSRRHPVPREVAEFYNEINRWREFLCRTDDMPYVIAKAESAAHALEAAHDRVARKLEEYEKRGEREYDTYVTSPPTECSCHTGSPPCAYCTDVWREGDDDA